MHITSEILRYVCRLVAITMYARYRQLAEYLSTSESHHPERVNKAALFLGVIVVLGMTLVANFPVCAYYLALVCKP